MAIKFSIKDQPKNFPAASGKQVSSKTTAPDEPAELPVTEAERLSNGVDLFESAPKPPSRKGKSK